MRYTKEDFRNLSAGTVSLLEGRNNQFLARLLARVLIFDNGCHSYRIFLIEEGKEVRIEMISQDLDLFTIEVPLKKKDPYLGNLSEIALELIRKHPYGDEIDLEAEMVAITREDYDSGYMLSRYEVNLLQMDMDDMSTQERVDRDLLEAMINTEHWSCDYEKLHEKCRALIKRLQNIA